MKNNICELEEEEKEEEEKKKWLYMKIDRFVIGQFITIGLAVLSIK